MLARHVADVLRRALAAHRTPRRLALVNELISILEAEPDGQSLGEERVAALEQLVALSREFSPGVHEIARPLTPLSDAALLTNARWDPSLSSELRSELASADRVDLLCAFIRWQGLRVLEDALTITAERGVPIRLAAAAVAP